MDKDESESCDACLSGENQAYYCRKKKGHKGCHSYLLEWDDKCNGHFA